MNTEKSNKEMLYKSSPAVSSLNRVPGFDPLKLLRRTKSAKTNEPVLRLDLPYKKLWFRLANPKGRIRVNALRITEQMAICEAQVYLNRDDIQPAGSFTASCTKDDAPDGRYIEAAQQCAVNEALSDAGFGLQFADVSMRPEDRRYGSEIPVSAIEIPEQPMQAVSTMRPAPTVQAAEAKAQEAQLTEGTIETISAPPAAADARREEAPVQAALAANVSSVTPDVAANTPPADETAAPAYTQESPVEEILRHMTPEQAMEVIVDTGVCNGWTLREVSEKRPASLKYYIFGGYKGKNNILRAGARLVFDRLNGEKAA